VRCPAAAIAVVVVLTTIVAGAVEEVRAVGARSKLRKKREDANGVEGPKEKCCYRCGKSSHFAHECRSKKKMGQANLA
jgi:hypothetical protein